jgi:hypothetical protein
MTRSQETAYEDRTLDAHLSEIDGPDTTMWGEWADDIEDMKNHFPGQTEAEIRIRTKIVALAEEIRGMA